jgi:hypothetical protein
MELSECEWQGCESYLGEYDVLMGDARTQRTFRGVIEGIIAGETVLAARIARFSPSAGSRQTR